MYTTPDGKWSYALWLILYIRILDETENEKRVNPCKRNDCS